MPQKGEFKAGAKPASVAKRKWNATKEQRERRSSRNKARRLMINKGRISKNSSMEVDHSDKNAMNNGITNLKIRKRKANHADNRGTGGRPVGS